MPPRPTLVAPLPTDLDLVLAIALAKNPEDRFDSAADLADALEGAAHGRLDPRLRSRAHRLLTRLDWTSA
jgi:serine/threonine-protein kinase